MTKKRLSNDDLKILQRDAYKAENVVLRQAILEFADPFKPLPAYDSPDLFAVAPVHVLRLVEALSAAPLTAEFMERTQRYEEALRKIAAHDGDRWEYKDGWPSQRKPMPQEIAQAALKGSSKE